METQERINYHRIAQAVEFIRNNFQKQPTLAEIAEVAHMSPAHFQRMFTQWAGTSPKKFLQYISTEHAKRILRGDAETTLFDTTQATGLSSTSRLHDLFITIEVMSPAEYKHGGASLEINYSFAKTPFGCMIVASTTKGICMMAFHDDQTRAFQELTTTFPKATFPKTIDSIQQNALSIFRYRDNILPNIKLHLKGTEFQLKVWNSLLKIPKGKLSTYGTIAHEIGNPKAARAVGTVIGSNPIAYLIPCHRVIQSSGSLSNYRWGTIRKTAMIGWEGVQTYKMR